MSARAALEAHDLRIVLGQGDDRFELRVSRLDLRRGETLAVLGPNGAGKSTLLRALAGLERPAAGRVERRAAGPVTMVFQRPAMLAGTVAYNVAVPLKSRRLPRTERRARVLEELDRLGIAALAQRRAATLSGGEARRLAIARAFVLEPAVLLLDEPFDDLDAAAQETLSLDLRRVVEETDVALAVVTHDLRRALLLADRIAVLVEGRLAQVDVCERVLHRPATPVIALLVGMSNLLPGEVVPGAGDGTLRVQIDADHALPARGPSPSGRHVFAGIRPEHLKVDVGRGEGVPIGKGVVRHVLSDGALVTVTIDWANTELRAHLLAGRGLGHTLVPGDPVSLQVRPEDVCLLPRDAAEAASA